MAKKVYVGQSDLARKVNEIYLGIDGKARKVVKGYVGVNGVAKQFWPDVVLYYWNKYNTKTTNRYYWNRYNRVTTYRYYWDRYNVNETTYYKWKRYNISTQTIYKWNKYSVSYPSNVPIPEDPNILFMTEARYADFSIINNTGEQLRLAHGMYSFMEPELGFDSNGNFVCGTGGATYQTIPTSGLQYEMYPYGDPPIAFPYDTFRRDYSGNPMYKFTINSKPGSNIAVIDGSTTQDDSYIVAYGIPVEYTKTLIGTVTSSNSDAYPNSGTASDGYYYEFQSSTQEQVQGSYIDDVESTNNSAYPQNGISGSYWYKYDSSRVKYSRGSANGSVNSTNRSQYPDDGKSGNYWYVYDRQTAEYSQGSYINQVSSTNRNQYPDNNYSGNYWYVYDHVNTTYSQGSYIGVVQSENPSAYPTNGRHTDGYWYVKQ